MVLQKPPTAPGPRTCAPMRASGSLNRPPPQPTSSAVSPASGSAPAAAAGLMPRELHTAWRMNPQRAGLSASSGANGPRGLHQWSARAANLAASLLSSDANVELLVLGLRPAFAAGAI